MLPRHAGFPTHVLKARVLDLALRLHNSAAETPGQCLAPAPGEQLSEVLPDLNSSFLQNSNNK